MIGRFEETNLAARAARDLGNKEDHVCDESCDGCEDCWDDEDEYWYDAEMEMCGKCFFDGAESVREMVNMLRNRAALFNAMTKYGWDLGEGSVEGDEACLRKRVHVVKPNKFVGGF